MKQQDALCPYCGEIFRVRSHSKACENNDQPWDPEVLALAEALVNAELRAWYRTHQVNHEASLGSPTSDDLPIV